MYPLEYIEPVFRPPSEWKSLILQITNGCSWNKCSFCDMYKDSQKKFKPKDINEIEKELHFLKTNNIPVNRVFLADGDAMCLSFRRLKEILTLIKKYYPNLQRVSSYCLPSNLKNKSVEELNILHDLGLKILYVGCETGDSDLLKIINKGETFDSSLEALQKIKKANIKSSVMILNGLGGKKHTINHAHNSSKLMNESQPDYLSTLVLEFPFGSKRFEDSFNGEYEFMNKKELNQEMKNLINNLDLQKTIFRSDHASNHLVLKGILGRDKNKLLNEIERNIY